MPGPLPFSTRAYDQVAPGMPEIRAVNVFVTPTPTGPTKYAMAQRWGLVARTALGAGPNRGLFQQSGLFGGDLFAVSGPTLYRGSAVVGATGNAGIARFAGSSTQLGLVDDGKFYVYDGTSLTWVANDKASSPLPLFIGVIFISERFLLLCGDGAFYWSDVDDGTQIDPLSFASAESSPDGAVEIAKLGDEFAIFGGSSVEWWFITGDANAPFQRSANRTYSRGCGSQGSVVQSDNSLIFVGEDRIVYRGALTPVAISTHGVEKRLAACSDMAAITAFSVTFAGHPFYVLNISGQGSFAYDFSSSEWAEWSSYGQTLFRCAWALMYAGAAVLGDAITGRTWTLSETAVTDGSDPLVRIGAVFIQRGTGVSPLRNLCLVSSRGAGTLTETTPTAELRVSKNGVGDWSNWYARPLGALGQRDLKTRWMGSFGRLESPGAWIEVRVSDPVSITLAGLIFDEPRP